MPGDVTITPNIFLFVVKYFSSSMFRGVNSIWYLQFYFVYDKLLTLLKLSSLFCHIV